MITHPEGAIPLDQRSSVSWLALLYRRPAKFCEAWDARPIQERQRAAVRIVAMLIPGLLVLSFSYNLVVRLLIPWLRSLSPLFESISEQSSLGEAAALIAFAVLGLELFLRPRHGDLFGEQPGSVRLQAIEWVLRRRFSWLVLIIAALNLIVVSQRWPLTERRGDRGDWRLIAATLAASAVPAACEIIIWLTRRTRREQEESTKLKKARNRERLAQRMLLYLPLCAFLYVFVFVSLGLTYVSAGAIRPGLIDPPEAMNTIWTIFTSSLWGVGKSLAVGLVSGVLIGWLSGVTEGVALGFVGAVAGGITLATTSVSAPTRVLMVGLCIALLYPILVGSAQHRSSAWRIFIVIIGVVAITSYWAVREKADSEKDYFSTEGLIRGVSLGFALGLCRGCAESVLHGKRMRVKMGILGAVIVGIIAGLSVVGQMRRGLNMNNYMHDHSAIEHGSLAAVVVGSAYLLGVLRLYYQPFSPLFFWPKPDGMLYPWHPVAWDDLSSVPFPGLSRLLVVYSETEPAAASTEIHRLLTAYDSQKSQAQLALAILLARRALAVSNLTELTPILDQLPEGDAGFLRETPRLRELISEIVHTNNRLSAMDRPVYREPTARALCTMIERFRYQVDHFQEPWATEFREASAGWLRIAEELHGDARSYVDSESTPQVFRAGDPVDRDREAFVNREGVISDLERQIMLGNGCPGIVLYGRRRMGKSTVLRNLGGFLPSSVRPITISMQDPAAFTSFPSFARLLGSKLRAVLPGQPPTPVAHDDLSGLYALISDCNQSLETEGRRILICIDEYEYLDTKIADRVFPADFLNLVRESIQSHRFLTWVFAGSHEITELTNAPWTSALISARTIEIPMFTEAETRLLLTDPLRHSRMAHTRQLGQTQPLYPLGFWGENGVERIHRQAGGWPHLLQLIAETLVDMMIEEDRRCVEADLWERALDQAVKSGHNVLYELMYGESRTPGEWEYLSGFRSNDAQGPPTGDLIKQSLRRRMLIAEENGSWRLRVPLMQRWLRARS